VVALQLLAARLRACPPGKASGVADCLGIEPADFLIALQAKVLGQARHCCRMHAGLSRLLPHRQQRHIARMIEYIARSRPQLGRHAVEGIHDLLR
jgi:hypothetical protein